MSTQATTEQQEPLPQITIVDCAKSCLESFQKCLNSTGKADKVTASLTSRLSPSLVRVEDQLARFSLWAANLNVFSASKASLDNRLREAPDVKDAIVALLETLNYRIKSCTRLINSTLCELTEQQLADSLQEFNDTLDNLRDEITLLHKISNTIRRASKETQNAKAVNFFKIRDDEGNDAEPFLRQLFMNYIRDRFSGTSEDIRIRLASTMILRRKQILYRRERYERAPIRLQAAVAKPVISHPRPEPTEEIAQGPMKRRVVEASSRSQVQSITKTATTLSPENFKRATVPSVISVSQTVALSSNDELCFPPPPTAGLMRRYNREKKNIELQYRKTLVSPPPDDYVAEPTEETVEGIENAAANFGRDLALAQAWESCIEAVAEVTCPYCFHVLPIREVLDEKKWKLHVKNDLDPYVCLFENCDSPEHLYSHSNMWIKHMKEHTLRWRCKSKAHGEFMAETRVDYVNHMKTSHPRKLTDAQLDVLADRNAHTIGPLFIACPLCGLEKTDMPMENHVVGHMRLLALKSLPPSYEDIVEQDGFDDQNDYMSDSGPGKRSTIQSAFEVDAYENWDSDEHEDDLVLQSPTRQDSEDETSSRRHVEYIPALEPSEPKDKGKRLAVIRMDPDCAICRAPANMGCDCEAKGLDIAVKQAENKVIVPQAKEIRRWVRDKVRKNFNYDKTTTDSAKKETESQCGGSSTNNDLRGINGGEVLDGPALYTSSGSNNGGLSEALDYYFGLVELRLPADNDPSVCNPPLEPGSKSVKESKNPLKRSKARVRFD
ncbi:unnamed protein product [Fusarium graminearum]|uniref:Chromosome 3, complete genome n=3 Tax=Gibberella zeae TaxID=5518 RepID=A0A0E0SJQ1_GIBZE|nr:hypothetical protein FG05_04821 [Fusarium graminearum]KAI6758054.1 hypothetical protein HG531_003879 [Fusarium graminearum]PCD34061.1 hypothetical protein FGRA07_09216 [Fusarium graminearum]CAF3570952.1 unnamed protein product [Fusarium graminearum]CAG1996736.1 unnamed protein product [Fusarium graminearum]